MTTASVLRRQRFDLIGPPDAWLTTMHPAVSDLTAEGRGCQTHGVACERPDSRRSYSWNGVGCLNGRRLQPTWGVDGTSCIPRHGGGWGGCQQTNGERANLPVAGICCSKWLVCAWPPVGRGRVQGLRCGLRYMHVEVVADQWRSTCRNGATGVVSVESRVSFPVPTAWKDDGDG